MTREAMTKRLIALANSLGGTEEDDIMAGVAEIERLQTATEYAFTELTSTRAEIERLRAALKPFAVPDKESLIATLGHIGREEIANARAALEPKP
jgi:hypothetical protein